MSVARTARDISRIPGVSSFRSPFRRSLQDQQVISLNPCSTCKKEFKFPHNTPWDEITRSVEVHARLCGRSVVGIVNMCRVADSTTQEILDRGSAVRRKRKRPSKTCRKLLQRRALLEDDPWTVTESVEPKRVSCAACGNVITLDQRRLYYPGLWIKHKERCASINEVFARAEKLLRPVIRRCFDLQGNDLERPFLDPLWFLELCGVVLGHRQKRKKKRRIDGVVRRALRATALESGGEEQDVEMDETSTDECWLVDTAQGSESQEQWTTSCPSLTSTEARAVSLQTSSMSLNAILCPVTADEIENRQKYMAARPTGDVINTADSQSKKASSSINQSRISLEGVVGQRYRPYSKSYRAILPRLSHPSGIVGGNKPTTSDQQYSHPNQSRGPPSRGCIGSNEIDSSSSCPSTPSTRLGCLDMTSENTSWASRSSSPSMDGETSKTGEYCDEDSSAPVRTLGSYTTYTSPTSLPSPRGHVVNTSAPTRHTASPSPMLPSLHGVNATAFGNKLGESNEPQPCFLRPPNHASQAIYSAQNPNLGDFSSYPVPRLRLATRADFERRYEEYDSDYSEGRECSDDGLDDEIRMAQLETKG